MKEQIALVKQVRHLTQQGRFTRLASPFEGDYAAWQYRPDSPLRELMVKKYVEMFDREPQVVAIHAGLECGLFGEKIPGLDSVSMGPQMHDIHTSREKLEIASTRRMWEYLLSVLAVM